VDEVWEGSPLLSPHIGVNSGVKFFNCLLFEGMVVASMKGGGYGVKIREKISKMHTKI